MPGKKKKVAVSKAQKNFMGMAHAIQRGATIPNASAKLKKAARTMSMRDTKQYAKTPSKGLPQKKRKKKPLHYGDTFNI